jgi:hypothetical protein
MGNLVDICFKKPSRNRFATPCDTNIGPIISAKVSLDIVLGLGSLSATDSVLRISGLFVSFWLLTTEPKSLPKVIVEVPPT